MLFAKVMSKRSIYILAGFTFFILLLGMLSGFNQEPNDDFSEKVKVSLRSIGHQLLLANQDSTSIVKPIIEMGEGKFQLSFENELSVEPKYLVTIIQESIEKSELPTNYLVEVKPCASQEVVYSYEMKNTQENSIIPCFGRVLEKNCYIVELGFSIKETTVISNQALFFILVLLVFFLLTVIYYKRNTTPETARSEGDYKILGCFQFYPEQNKLIKEALEISLSKKECEILSILIEQPNQIIKRDELTKRVWEDNGVVVGRSLDTYISKLRKKLKDDTSIKITNVHGVGYKLELG